MDEKQEDRSSERYYMAGTKQGVTNDDDDDNVSVKGLFSLKIAFSFHLE